MSRTNTLSWELRLATICGIATLGALLAAAFRALPYWSMLALMVLTGVFVALHATRQRRYGIAGMIVFLSFVLGLTAAKLYLQR
jgi:uncharacterized membrane protein YccC